MNAMLVHTLPLPACLADPNSTGSHRRHRIGTIDLTDTAVDRFNRLLEGLGRSDRPFDPDRLVTAARELCSHRFTSVSPACIRQRLHRVKAAVRMVEDRDWNAPEEAAASVHLMAEYVATDDDLIPDATPLVGRLDDAIVIDTAWPRIDAEFDAWLDFRRLRHVLVPRGSVNVRFDRADWKQARLDEAALLAHYRQVRDASYVAVQAPLFAIR